MPTHIEQSDPVTGVALPVFGEHELDHDDKNLDEITPANDEKNNVTTLRNTNLTEEQRNQLRLRYGRKAEEDDIAPARDVQMMLDRIVEMNDDEALDVLVTAIENHRIDPNFPAWTMDKLKALVLGYKACDMSEDDWSFDVRTEAAILKYHSPYPEVRSVTDPFDDPNLPVETFRAYTLGLIFMAGATGLNTFFSQRQPAIGLSSLIMQLLLAPSGWFWAKVVPQWTIKLGKWRIPINGGPWSFKEQCFATILFTIVNGAGSAQLLILTRRCKTTTLANIQNAFPNSSVSPGSTGATKSSFHCPSKPLVSPSPVSSAEWSFTHLRPSGPVSCPRLRSTGRWSCQRSER